MYKPKGFGKNYFSLASIQAYSSLSTLRKIEVKTKSHLTQNIFEEESSLEEDPPDELLDILQPALKQKPCSCNYYYKTRCTLHIKNHPIALNFIPIFQLYNTVSSPPKSNSY
ncbi:MAG: hypothetical protein U9N42_11690 [Campylobacterota bacterium]|nr:hypothetical protein [Campylobacterota bacterium]